MRSGAHASRSRARPRGGTRKARSMPPPLRRSWWGPRAAPPGSRLAQVRVRRLPVACSQPRRVPSSCAAAAASLLPPPPPPPRLLASPVSFLTPRGFALAFGTDDSADSPQEKKKSDLDSSRPCHLRHILIRRNREHLRLPDSKFQFQCRCWRWETKLTSGAHLAVGGSYRTRLTEGER